MCVFLLPISHPTPKFRNTPLSLYFLWSILKVFYFVNLFYGKKKRIYIPEKKSSVLRSSWALPLYVAQGVSRNRAFFAIDRAGGLDLAKGLVGFTRHTEQLSVYISKKAYPSHKELAQEMSTFSSRKPVIKDYADLKPVAQKGAGLGERVAKTLASTRLER